MCSNVDITNNLDITNIVGYPDSSSSDDPDDQLSGIAVESVSSFHSDSLMWSDLNMSLWAITQEADLLESTAD